MRTYHRITPAGLLGMLFGLGLLAPATARALDRTAGNEADLADAIAQVNAETATGTHTITLAADIALTASTTAIDNATAGVEIVIDGAGFTVDGQNTPGVRPLTISAGIAEIQNTIITGGDISFGGGVHNAGTLTMTNCTISGNNATFGGGIFSTHGLLTMTNCTVSANNAFRAGGIQNLGGTLTMTNCTVSTNNASGSSGGIGNELGGTLTMTNSTVSANNAAFGGGIFNDEFDTLTMTNCTVSGNNASGAGGGIFSTGPLTMTATVVAGNTAGSSSPDVGSRPLTSGGYNLISNGSGSSGFRGPGDQVGTAVAPIDPLLGLLADNGGPTQTHALLLGSPALDAIPAEDCAVATDQRGIARPRGSGCDIGAFEARFDSLRGDADGDGDVDLADLLEIVECLSTAGSAIGDGCAIFDFDQDRDVDLGDFIAFQAAFTGAR